MSDETAIAIPERVQGAPVPRTVGALEKILDESKGSKKVLPWRASHLAHVDPALKSHLYLLGGIPEVVAPTNVLIFAGRPYVSAEGATQGAFDSGRVRSLTWNDPAQPWKAVPCRDPNSGCPSFHQAAEHDITYLCTVTAVLDTGQRFMETGTACPHNWQASGGKPGKGLDRGKLKQMAATRARRRACMPLIGLNEDAIHEPLDDFTDGEVIDDDGPVEPADEPAPAPTTTDTAEEVDEEPSSPSAPSSGTPAASSVVIGGIEVPQVGGIRGDAEGAKPIRSAQVTVIMRAGQRVGWSKDETKAAYCEYVQGDHELEDGSIESGQSFGDWLRKVQPAEVGA